MENLSERCSFVAADFVPIADVVDDDAAVVVDDMLLQLMTIWGYFCC